MLIVCDFSIVFRPTDITVVVLSSAPAKRRHICAPCGSAVHGCTFMCVPVAVSFYNSVFYERQIGSVRY